MTREAALEAALRRMLETFGPLTDALNPHDRTTAVAEARRVLAGPGDGPVPAHIIEEFRACALTKRQAG